MAASARGFWRNSHQNLRLETQEGGGAWQTCSLAVGFLRLGAAGKQKGGKQKGGKQRSQVWGRYDSLTRLPRGALHGSDPAAELRCRAGWLFCLKPVLEITTPFSKGERVPAPGRSKKERKKDPVPTLLSYPEINQSQKQTQSQHRLAKAFQYDNTLNK